MIFTVDLMRSNVSSVLITILSNFSETWLCVYNEKKDFVLFLYSKRDVTVYSYVCNSESFLHQ